MAIPSENRLRLGVGTGWNKIEYQALNEEFTSRNPRPSRPVPIWRELGNGWMPLGGANDDKPHLEAP